MAHTCPPRPGGMGLFSVELEPVSSLGRRIWALGPYKSTWNNGCDECMAWKVCQRTEHIVSAHYEVGVSVVSQSDATLLRARAGMQGRGWLVVAFQDIKERFMMVEKEVGLEQEDSTKAIIKLVRMGVNHQIARITTSEAWRPPTKDIRYEVIKLPVESYAEAQRKLFDAGFENGFARPGMSISQIEWQLREQFDPGIDLR